MAFYYSPFECTFQESKQTVVDCSYLRVIGGAQYPSDSIYSQVRGGACFPKYDGPKYSHENLPVGEVNALTALLTMAILARISSLSSSGCSRLTRRSDRRSSTASNLS